MNKLGQLAAYTGESDVAPAAAKSKPVSYKPSTPEDGIVGEHHQSPAIQQQSNQVLQSVIEMQRQLIDLYTTFKSKPEIASMFSETSESPFFKFMLDRYVSKSQPHSDLSKTNFTRYVQMLSAVGQHTKDGLSKPDGVWGNFTENALIAATSIAYAMVSLSNQFGDKISFSQNDLDGLTKLTPKTQSDFSTLNSNTKNKLATEIAPLIGKLKQSVNDFIVIMTDASHQYSQYISGDKKFDVFKSSSSNVNKNDLQLASKLQNDSVQGVFVPQDLSNNQSEKISLTYNDIMNKDNFVKFLKDNNIQVGGKPANDISVINFLKKQIASAKSKMTGGV
jgi:hypothetical protein